MVDECAQRGDRSGRVRRSNGLGSARAARRENGGNTCECEPSTEAQRNRKRKAIVLLGPRSSPQFGYRGRSGGRWASRLPNDRGTVAGRPRPTQGRVQEVLRGSVSERGRARARSRSPAPSRRPRAAGRARSRPARLRPSRAPDRRRPRSRRRSRPGSPAARSRSGRVVPRRSSIGAKPATPIATSVVPCRNGRPNESVTITPTVRPVSSRSRSRSVRALASGSTGSSTSVPASGAFEWSTPADAQMKPCWVSAITSGPRSRMIRFASRRITSTSRGSRSSPASSLRLLGGVEVVDAHDPALGLRHDLLRDHDDVVVLELDGPGDQRREVVARPDLRQAVHGQELDHGRRR